MTFARFELTSFSGVGTVEVVTADGPKVYAAGEQGRLWTGVWARPRPAAVGGCLCDGEHVCGDGNATARQRRPSLRLIQGGKT